MIKKYLVTVKHDAGTKTLLVSVTKFNSEPDRDCEAVAKTLVMAAEFCPECAIVRVKLQSEKSLY